MAWIPLVPLAAAAVSGVASFFGQKSNNAANEAMSHEQMRFNADQADINRMYSAGEAAKLRDWQHFEAESQRVWSEEMSASSYQRAVGDLQKAGLNPMLAYSQGGAPMPQSSVPSGGMGSGSAASYSNIPRRENAAQAAVTSALTGLQLSSVGADIKLKEAQADREVATAENVRASTETERERPSEVRQRIDLMASQAWSEDSKRMLSDVQRELVRVDTLVAQKKIPNVEADTAMKKISTILDELKVPEARAFAHKYEGGFGKEVTPYLREVLDIIRHLVVSRSILR